MPGKDWTVFSPNHSTYEPLETGSLQAEDDANNGLSTNLITVLRVIRYLLLIFSDGDWSNYRFIKDCGKFDGIQRIIFGSGLDFWLHRLLLLDSMSFLSHGKVSTSLQRFIQVDVDDIFVGQKGIRLTPNDVEVITQPLNWTHKQLLTIISFHCRLSLKPKIGYGILFPTSASTWDFRASSSIMELKTKTEETISCLVTKLSAHLLPLAFFPISIPIYLAS